MPPTFPSEPDLPFPATVSTKMRHRAECSRKKQPEPMDPQPSGFMWVIFQCAECGAKATSRH